MLEKKNLNHSQKVAILLLFILSIAFYQQSRVSKFFEPRINDFTATPSIIDVGDHINFSWTLLGEFDVAIITFGDGNQTKISLTQEHEAYSILHSYALEGKYNASVYVANTLTRNEDWDACLITVQNDPPFFDISVPTHATEDELVNVSIINLKESNHDLAPGILSFIIDFGDGNQTNTNSSSILHKWTNEGIYPVVVTVIDDQGALNQKVKEIVISNKAPDPDFTIGSEIPATYSFSADLIGALPFRWNTINNESKNSFTVIEGTDGHQKILEIKSNQSSDVGICNTFKPQSKGSIEFWFMSTNISSSLGVFSFKDSNKIELFAVFMKNYYLKLVFLLFFSDFDQFFILI